MSQADYVVSNGTGASVRSDLNGQLAAIVSNNSGAAEPATMYAYQWWANTTTGSLLIRNSANNAWVTVGTLASANLGLATLASPTFTGTATIPTLTVSTSAGIPLGSAGSPTLFFTGDTNTGAFSPGADTFAITTGGTNRLHVTSGGLVGIGNSSPRGVLHIGGDLYSGATDAAAINLKQTSTTASTGIYLERSVERKGYYIYLGGDADSLNFQRNNNGTKSDVMTLTRDGLVGIGTTGPGRLLTVNGDFGINNGGGSGGAEIFSVTNAGGSPLINATSNATALTFGYNGTEGFRLDSSRRLLLGTSTAATGSLLEVDAGSNVAEFHHTSSSDTIGIYMRHGRGLSGFAGKMITFRRNDNTEVGSVVIGVSSVAYNTSSDYRLKENVAEISEAVERVLQLNPVKFNFIDDPDRTVDGFIAHEAQAIVPECVTGEKDAEDDDGNPVYQGIDQSKLVPLLTAALQEALAEISALKDRVAALEAQ